MREPLSPAAFVLVLLAALWVMFFCVGCASHDTPHTPEPEQTSPAHYLVPLTAKNTDWVCAETVPKHQNYCMTVEAFRRHVTSLKAVP